MTALGKLQGAERSYKGHVNTQSQRGGCLRGWSGHINNNHFSISIFLVKFSSGTSRNRQKRDVQRGINAGNRPH